MGDVAAKSGLDTKSGLVTFRAAQGLDLRGSLLRFTRHEATFEVYIPNLVIRTSEVLEDFKVFVQDRLVYSGRAVVRDLVNAGSVLVVGVVIEDSYFDVEFFTNLSQTGQLCRQFDGFLQEWQTVWKVRSEFKVAVADIHTFLLDLRRWLDQVELGIRSSPQLDRGEQERAAIDELSPQVIPVLDDLFENFELIAASLSEDECPVHRSYIQRHLHPIVLCAPFAYRSYRKPLGYAGDYELVNMMLRDPQEGSSLFAKVFNVWLLQQGSAAAHRNRVDFLKERLIEETATAARAGRKARILNLGCGPAWEVQDFLAQTQLSDSAQFTLMDFNDETLQHAGQALREKQERHQRTTSISLVKKSVQQLLKDTVRTDGLGRGEKFDLVYCAGLFDYLPDHVCKRLMNVFYESLLPGGLALATNVSTSSPNRGSLQLILDWHLCYRDAARTATLRPQGLQQEAARVLIDATGVNVFLEARKPNG